MEKWTETLKFNTLSVEDVDDVIEKMRDSEDVFLQGQADKLEHYLNQYGNEIITKSQFESYLLDLHDLTRVEMVRQKIKDRALTQRTLAIVSELLVKGAISLAKTVI